MRINAQTCHDVKCKKEKEYFQKIISKMADSFTELISQVEKQVYMTFEYSFECKSSAKNSPGSGPFAQ
jgi:hypothetical protein